MVKLFCVIVGAQGSAFPVDIDASQFVGDLKKAITTDQQLDFVASKLQLFQAKTENGNGWLSSDDGAVIAMRTGAIPEQVKTLLKDEIDPAEEIGDKFRNAPTEKTVHVLVVVPEVAAGSPLLQSEYSAAFSNIAWYGKRGSTVDGEGVNLKDPRTLYRDILTADIIRRLKEKNVLLVKSPPMTGKTSLAALVSRSLMDRHIIENEKVNVFNFTALGRYEDETFEELFKRQCKIDWKDAVATFPAKSDCMVYLVVDEVQVIYREGDRRNSSSFWEMIKSVLSDEKSRLRILMFAAYGSRLEYRQRVKLEDDTILDTNWLGFTHAEVSEYVQKWFKGITCFERSSLSAMEEFCSSLEELTGGHVGLCMTTIRELNKVYDSNIRSASHQPLPAKWIRMLQTGSLYREDDSVLFDALTSTRAVSVLNTLGKIELDELGRIAYGVACDFDAGVVEQCLRKGILVQTECAERRFEFSSPVMWRFFVKLSVRDLVRALHAPNTLPEMIARVMRAIDYDSIRNTLGRSLASDSPLERAWQMEFYKAVYRCTPSTFKTSADVVALFGSSGYVDFTVHEGDNLWGIELLREASNLSEHIERFSPGGRYSAVPFTDFCLVDFRRVDSIDDVPIKGIAKNMCDCDKLVMTQKWQVLWRLIPQWLSSTGLHLSSLQREYDFLNLVAALDANVQKIEVK